MKKKFLNIQTGSILKFGAWLIVAILFIAAISAVFKACNENSIRDDENERAKIELEKTQHNQKVYLSGSKWGYFQTLKQGENHSIPIPRKLGVELGEPEDDGVVLEYKKDNDSWEKYFSNGKPQHAGYMNELVVRVNKDTRVWVQFFYRKQYEDYVRQAYLSRKY